MVKCVCKVCKKEFFVRPSWVKLGAGKHCSRKCVGVTYKTQLIGKGNPFFGRKHSKKTINIFSKLKKGKPCDFIKTKFRKGDVRVLGSNNANWRGDSVGYGALHDWVKRILGSPNQCEICNKTNQRYCWANKSGDYKRDVSDWMQLCYSCHKKHDLLFSKLSTRSPLKEFRILRALESK